MRRDGLADQVLSECMALNLFSYHKTDDHHKHARLHIDPADFMKRYDRRLCFAGDDRTALEGLEYLSLPHEDVLMDAARHQATADRVLGALWLATRLVHTDLRRIGGNDPREQLENYDEIEAALAARGIGCADGQLPRRQP